MRTIKRILIDRFAYTDQGVFGALAVDNFRCFTIERPWLNNRPNISAIPTGVYIAVRGTFRDKYDNYELQDVPGRSFIEIHRGNTINDLKGCIAPGMSFEANSKDNRYRVNRSADAMDAFMQAMAGSADAIVIIKNRGDAIT